MNAVVAIDSLKGSLTSMEAGRAVCEGIRRVYPDAVVSVRPLADGGDVFCDGHKKPSSSLAFLSLFPAVLTTGRPPPCRRTGPGPGR